MKIKTALLALCLFSLIISGCAPKPDPGDIAGAPDPVFYGGCSPHTVAFIYALPSEIEEPAGTRFVYAQYRLIGSDGSEVAKDQVRLTTAGGAFTGSLDMNPLGPLLKGGEGSLVFYGQVMSAWPFMKTYLPYKEIFHSDSKVVDVLPCPPTPTPTITLTPTSTPTITPEPTKKSKKDEPPPCNPNDPNNPCPPP